MIIVKCIVGLIAGTIAGIVACFVGGLAILIIGSIMMGGQKGEYYSDLAFLFIPIGAIVGSSSLRRKAQLLFRRPDLRIVEFRGNVQTRLSKLALGSVDATLLAMAGLNRLGVKNINSFPIQIEQMLPAVAQGAIGVEQRLDTSYAPQPVPPAWAE